MNSIKIKLIKKAPFLFHNELDGYVREYRLKYDSFECVKDEVTLEKIIGDSVDKEFMNYLVKKLRCTITLNKFTPDSLLHNRSVLDAAMERNSSCIFRIPEEMITDQYVDMYENGLKTSSYPLIALPAPKKFLERPEILEVYREYYLEKDKNYAYNLDQYLNFISYNRDYYEKVIGTILDKIDKYLDSRNSLRRFYQSLNSIVQNDERIIEMLLKKDLSLYDVIYLKVGDLARKIAKKLLMSREVSLNVMSDSLLYQDQEIIMAYLHYIIGDFDFDNIDLDKLMNLYKETTTIGNNMAFVNWRLNHDDELLLLKLAYTIVRNIPGSLFNSVFSSQNFLKTYLDSDLVPQIPLNYFSGSIFTKDMESLFVLRLWKMNGNDLSYIFEIYSYSETFFNLILKKIIVDNDERYKKILSENNNYLVEEIFSLENINLFLENIDKFDFNIIHTAIKVNAKNATFFRKFFLQTKDRIKDIPHYKEYLLLFEKWAIDSEMFNTLFRVVPFSWFYELASNRDNIFSELKFETLEDMESSLEHIMEGSENSFEEYIVYVVYILQKYKESGYKSDYLDRMISLYEKILKEELFKFGEDDQKEVAVNKLLMGERKAFSIPNIKNERTFNYFLSVGDILSTKSYEYIMSLPDDVIKKINKKHLGEIASLLKELIGNSEWIDLLAINIYVSLGYTKARDFLSKDERKNYGPLDESHLLRMFRDICVDGVLFKKEGNGYVPILNNNWINVVFGNNGKVKNTPVRNFLNDYKDRKEELKVLEDKLLEEIDSNYRLSAAEKIDRKVEVKKKVDAMLEEYISDMQKFFGNMSLMFNEWDIIEEEFIKAQTKSKLKIKLNIRKINELVDGIKVRRRMPKLEPRDRPLSKTDIFNYVGYDTQYTAKPEKAPERAILLSRGMENIRTKKFPNISIRDNDYLLKVYHPQDRSILVAGYKSKCCFRPNGNADNEGKDNSLVRYCTNTTYGGGLEIVDDKGELIMFSPLLRSGNVLMVHSIETTKFSNETNLDIRDRVHQLLEKFALEVIRISEEEKDPIDFVVITDLHYLDDKYVKGSLTNDVKFDFYDESGSYKGMYHNMSQNNKILASREGVTFAEIRYGKVEHNYSYPKDRSFSTFTFNQELISIIEKIDILRDRIIELSEKRALMKKDKKFDEAYRMVYEIKELKEKYRQLYKDLVIRSNGQDYYEDYKRAKDSINYITKEKGMELNVNIKEVSYGNDWFIIITRDNKLMAFSLDSGLEECNIYYNNLKQYNPQLEAYPINSMGMEYKH